MAAASWARGWPGPGPAAADAVDDYVGRVRVFPVTDTGQTFVEWTSTYESDDPDAVGELCDPIYQALLQAFRPCFRR